VCPRAGASTTPRGSPVHHRQRQVDNFSHFVLC